MLRRNLRLDVVPLIVQQFGQVLPRQALRDADGVEDGLGREEDLLHLLEGAAGGLGEEEVDAGDDGGVDGAVDDEVAVADVGETDGGDLGIKD